MNKAQIQRALELYKRGEIDKVAKVLSLNGQHPPQTAANTDMTHLPDKKHNVTTVITANSRDNTVYRHQAPVLPENGHIIKHNDNTNNNNINNTEVIERAVGTANEVVKDYNGEKVLSEDLPPEIDEAMAELLKIDENLSKIRKLKKVLDDKKKYLEDILSQFMEEWEIPEIGPDENIGLQFQVKESKQGYSKKFVTDKLSQMFPPDTFQKIMKILESERQVTETTKLKLKKPRAKRQRTN